MNTIYMYTISVYTLFMYTMYLCTLCMYRGVVSGGRVKDRGESTFSRDHTVVPPVPDR